MIVSVGLEQGNLCMLPVGHLQPAPDGVGQL